MLAEAVREKLRLERELTIVTARINTLAAEITSIIEREHADETAVIPALTDETRVLQTVRPYVSESAGASAAENRRKGRAETFALTPIADRIERCHDEMCKRVTPHVHTPAGHIVSVIKP